MKFFTIFTIFILIGATFGEKENEKILIKKAYEECDQNHGPHCSMEMNLQCVNKKCLCLNGSIWNEVKEQCLFYDGYPCGVKTVKSHYTKTVHVMNWGHCIGACEQNRCVGGGKNPNIIWKY